MSLFLYFNSNNEITGFIENVSSQEAEEIAATSAEATLYLEDAEFPVYKKGHVIKHNGTEFYYEKVEEPTPSTPEPSQLDRIESTLNLLTADTVSASSVTEAITEGVNDV